MILLLQREEGKSGEDWQEPFHEEEEEIGERFSSEKLLSSGQIPVSRTPTITSSA